MCVCVCVCVCVCAGVPVCVCVCVCVRVIVSVCVCVCVYVCVHLVSVLQGPCVRLRLAAIQDRHRVHVCVNRWQCALVGHQEAG